MAEQSFLMGLSVCVWSIGKEAMAYYFTVEPGFYTSESVFASRSTQMVSSLS